MTIRQQVIHRIANTKNNQLLHELLAFLDERERLDPDRPPRGSYEAIMRHAGTISEEDAKEMTDIINREFNNIEGEW